MSLLADALAQWFNQDRHLPKRLSGVVLLVTGAAFLWSYRSRGRGRVGWDQSKPRPELDRPIAERIGGLARTFAGLERREGLVELAYDAILICSKEWMITDWNRGSEKLYGWTREEATGRVSHELLKTKFPFPLSELEGELSRHGYWDGELTRERRDGSRIVVAGRWILNREGSEAGLILEIDRDITKYKMAEEALRRREAELQEAQSLAGVGSWEWEPVTDHVSWSVELYRIARRDPTLPPPTYAEHACLYTAESFDLLQRTVSRTLQNGEPYELELEMIGGDGVHRWILSRGRASFDSAGKVVKLHGTAQDITERRQQNEDLRMAHTQAMLATRAKRDFLANMSHEIRTPMNGVLGMAELVLGTSLDDRQRDYVETIRSSGEALLTIINDVLDFAKIEAGKLKIEDVDFDLRTLMEEVAGLLGPGSRKKGVSLNCRIDPGIPSSLRGDVIRIRQILINLAGNAVKFTDRGEVDMEAIAIATAGNETTIRIRVRDTGIGIPEDRLSHIFDSFTQVEVDNHRRHGGTGLGLAICRNLVDLMGGRIGVESKPGRGSSFWFELTLRGTFSTSLHDRPSPQAVDPQEFVSPLGFRILLAEDNEVNRRVAIGMAERLGCQVDAVENGREALKALRYDRHDLVLMDVQMPEMDGLAATRAIRELECSNGKHVPIVAMTAHAFQVDRDRCLSAGMDGYLSKPVRPGPLREAIAALRIKTRESRPFEEVETPLEDCSFQIDSLRQACGDDPELIREVIRLFLAGTPSRLERVEHAIQSRDGRLLAWESHALQGGFPRLGASDTARSFQQLKAQG